MRTKTLIISPMVTIGLLSLAGCHADSRYSAARDVRAFLRAAKVNDVKTFEVYLDREALGRDLQRQAGSAGAADRLVRPDVFSVQVVGNADNTLPSRTTFAFSLRWIEKGRVCLPASPAKTPCALTFQNEAGTWKLTGMRLSVFRPAEMKPS